MKLMYFAWVREKAGLDQEELELPPEVETVKDLLTWQKTRGVAFESAFENLDVIRVAVNQTHVKHDHSLKDAEEIAFFPPVTGG